MRPWQVLHAVAISGCVMGLLSHRAASQELAPDRDAQSLIERISAEDARIKDISCHLEITDAGTGRTWASIDWGSDGGMEYHRGRQWNPVSTELLKESVASDAAARPYWETEIAAAFDGERMCIFRKSRSWLGDRFAEEPSLTGRVAPLEPATFGNLSLHMLTGQSMSGVKRVPLGTALRGSREVRAWQQTANVDGHECRVLEALGFLEGVSRNNYGLRVWVDAACGFRPRQMEQHIQYRGGPLWGVLVYRVDRIRLEQVDGYWIPTEGVQAGFNPAESLKAVETGRPPEPVVPAKHYAVQVPTVRINKGIARDMFTVVFPPGTKVLDEFLDGQPAK